MVNCNKMCNKTVTSHFLLEKLKRQCSTMVKRLISLHACNSFFEARKNDSDLVNLASFSDFILTFPVDQLCSAFFFEFFSHEFTENMCTVFRTEGEHIEKDHEKTRKVQEKTSSDQKVDSVQKQESVSEPKFSVN